MENCQVNKQGDLAITPASKLKRDSKRHRASAIGRLAAGWMILQTCFLATPVLGQQKANNTLSYSEFLEKLDQEQVVKVEIDETTNKASVVLQGQSADDAPKEVVLFERNQDLIPKIRAKQVDFSIKSSVDHSTTVGILLNLLVILVLLSGLIMILRRSANASGQALNFGRSKAKFQMEAKTGKNYRK